MDRVLSESAEWPAAIRDPNSPTRGVGVALPDGIPSSKNLLISSPGKTLRGEIAAMQERFTLLKTEGDTDPQGFPALGATPVADS